MAIHIEWQLDYDYFFKFLLIGDSGVGKTSLLFRFADGIFHETNISMTGLDFKIKSIELKGKRLRLQIWDTAGQERFHAITTSYYHNANGIVLVYDVSNAKSFAHIAEWLRVIQQHADDNVEKMILGNKCDAEDKRVITEAQGRALAEKHGIKFLETSAVSNINVDGAFRELSTECLCKAVLEIVDDIKEQSEILQPPNSGGIGVCQGCCKN